MLWYQISSLYWKGGGFLVRSNRYWVFSPRNIRNIFRRLRVDFHSERGLRTDRTGSAPDTFSSIQILRKGVHGHVAEDPCTTQNRRRLEDQYFTSVCKGEAALLQASQHQGSPGQNTRVELVHGCMTPTVYIK